MTATAMICRRAQAWAGKGRRWSSGQRHGSARAAAEVWSPTKLTGPGCQQQAAASSRQQAEGSTCPHLDEVLCGQLFKAPHFDGPGSQHTHLQWQLGTPCVSTFCRRRIGPACSSPCSPP